MQKKGISLEENFCVFSARVYMAIANGKYSSLSKIKLYEAYGEEELSVMVEGLIKEYYKTRDTSYLVEAMAIISVIDTSHKIHLELNKG